MAGLTYKLWLLQLIGAFYASLLLYKALRINKLNRGGQLFAYIGELSMVILCVHSIDYMLNISGSIVSHFNLSNLCGIPLNMLFKLLFAALGTLIIKNIPILHKVYIAK